MKRLLALAAVVAGCIPNGPPTGTSDAGVSAGAVPTTPKRPPAAIASRDGERAPDPMITEPFVDAFERGAIGDGWRALSGAWRIENGRLCGKGGHNRGIWLARKIPTNARIEFDATSASPEGDIKAEAWGDGLTGATANSYSNATSYLVLFGAWSNTKHMLARLDEHRAKNPVYKVDPLDDDPRGRPVAAGQTYRFTIERTDGHTVRWLVDDVVMHRFDDPEPLKGDGHDHFGFNDWETAVCFDNLRVVPLE